MDGKQTMTEGLIEDSKRLFDASVDDVDAAAAARLRLARQRAAREVAPRAWFASPRLWLPAAAAAGLLAVLVLPGLQLGAPAGDRSLGTAAAADLDILLGEEELEMLAEFEFYEWLDLQGDGTATDGIEDGIG
jgi:hypothetical protein